MTQSNNAFHENENEIREGFSRSLEMLAQSKKKKISVLVTFLVPFLIIAVYVVFFSDGNRKLPDPVIVAGAVIRQRSHVAY